MEKTMEETIAGIKFVLDNNVHSPKELVEACKWALAQAEAFEDEFLLSLYEGSEGFDEYAY